MQTSGTFPIYPLGNDEDWRVARALNLYRWTLAVGFCALFFTGVFAQVFEVMSAPLFGSACVVYLLACLPTSFAAHKRRPALGLQVYLLVAIDIAFVLTLVLASAGVESGLGMLLIAPIAGASILVPRRMAALLAAVASISMLLEEIWRNLLYPSDGPAFAQAGILGVLFFISAGVANSLAMRARRSAALAASRKSELDDLAVLNERVIQSMQIGLVVIDEQRHIRRLNRAARLMLNLQSDSVGRPLAAVAAPLAWALEAWEVSPQLWAEPFNTGKYSLIPRFNRLGHGLNTPILIFIEDAKHASEQAQQIKLAALGRLTASIAHEIRNPLSAISHAGQLLNESGHLDADDHHMLDIMQRHTGRIEQIVQSVLGLSRRGETMPSQISLASWIAATIKDYVQGRENAPQFDASAIPVDTTLQVDPNHLRQILYNLWENSERHARLPDQPLIISIGAGNGAESDYLDVADNGPGLHGYSLAQLIEPFFTTTSDGTGLGLYIVRELCECNFARLDLAPGTHTATSTTVGTAFRITFARAGHWENAPVMNAPGAA